MLGDSMAENDIEGLNEVEKLRNSAGHGHLKSVKIQTASESIEKVN
jgi:hypothetical protein